VTVNAVLPGTIDTPANRSWGTAEQAGRWVKPESIADAILWLASDDAADVNGALVPVYGRS
jgi:NAD(P)-dependent dehydrogenase (short-subunit alcohol dehydrogenase family)